MPRRGASSLPAHVLVEGGDQHRGGQHHAPAGCRLKLRAVGAARRLHRCCVCVCVCCVCLSTQQELMQVCPLQRDRARVFVSTLSCASRWCSSCRSLSAPDSSCCLAWPSSWSTCRSVWGAFVGWWWLLGCDGTRMDAGVLGLGCGVRGFVGAPPCILPVFPLYSPRIPTVMDDKEVESLLSAAASGGAAAANPLMSQLLAALVQSRAECQAQKEQKEQQPS
jgi:hypothetical protein